MLSSVSRISCVVPLGLLLGCLVTPGEAQSTVVSHPALFPGSSSNTAWTSSSSSAFITSDNFTLSSAASLTGITWQGFTFNGNGGAAGTEPASFSIEFRADNGGIPGTVLDNELVAPTKSLAGNTDFFGSGQQQNLYNYTASLSGTFKASGGAALWVSIIGNTTAPNFWTWTQGTGGDGSSYQEVSGSSANGTSGPRTGDRAFSLAGAPVPEASQAASFGLLLALGLGGLVIASKRKRTVVKASSAL